MIKGIIIIIIGFTFIFLLAFVLVRVFDVLMFDSVACMGNVIVTAPKLTQPPKLFVGVEKIYIYIFVFCFLILSTLFGVFDFNGC